MSIKSLSPRAPLADTSLLVTQGAAIASTLLYAVPATQGGLYTIKFYLKVTRAATTSSTLGAITITFTDAGDSVAQSVVLQGSIQTGATGTTVTTNTTVAVFQGQATINAKAGTNVNYAVAYVSSGGTSMQFEGRITLSDPF